MMTPERLAEIRASLHDTTSEPRWETIAELADAYEFMCNAFLRVSWERDLLLAKLSPLTDAPGGTGPR